MSIYCKYKKVRRWCLCASVCITSSRHIIAAMCKNVRVICFSLSLHKPIQFSEGSPSSFSFVKMSSPVHVHSGARSKTALRLPSKLYLMKTSSWAEFNISVDSSDCKAHFPFLTLSTSWHFMSRAMSVNRRAIVPLDSALIPDHGLIYPHAWPDLYLQQWVYLMFRRLCGDFLPVQLNIPGSMNEFMFQGGFWRLACFRICSFTAGSFRSTEESWSFTFTCTNVFTAA